MLFDDFLGLSALDLSSYGLIVFHGRSGSGKSTAIEFLLQNHFRNRAVIVVDEIATPLDLVRARRLLRSSTTRLVASHVPPFLFRLFARRIAVFRTDRDSSKIARHLQRRGVRASNAAVDEYVRRFGATYTDVDLILERYSKGDFDRALGRFLKFDDLRLSPASARR